MRGTQRPALLSSRQAYSLAHLSALTLNPMQLIAAAAHGGYDYVGLRLNRTTEQEPLYDLINDRELMRGTKAALHASGIEGWDVEAARMDEPRDHEHYRGLLEAAAERTSSMRRKFREIRCREVWVHRSM